MAKAVLVMEMPEKCSKCTFSYEFQGIKKCQLLNMLCNSDKAIIPTEKYTKSRKEECPLVELPEKMDGLMAAEMMPYCENPVAFAHGWNALREKIVGRKE